MANWEKSTADLGTALKDATNGSGQGDTTGPLKDEEKCKQARDAGWAAPQAYNYAAASAKHGEQVETSSTAQVNQVSWAHEAERYEWQEDYGDVGPEVPELEAQLFKGDLRTKIGQHLDK